MKIRLLTAEHLSEGEQTGPSANGAFSLRYCATVIITYPN